MTEQASEGGQQLAIHRIYVKDLSFEAPKAPEMFRREWNPAVNLDINTSQNALEDGVHEIVLTISVTVKNGEEVAFIAEIQQAGIFTLKGFDEESLSHMFGAFCPNILFPYAREALDSMVLRGSFPALMLNPINFDALYAQELARRQGSTETRQ